MPPKKRNTENKGLPKRWRFRSGTYYYRVPKGMEHRWDGKTEYPLGRSLSAAYKEFASRLEYFETGSDFESVIDRYRLEVTPEKAKSTQNQEQIYLSQLRDVYGKSQMSEFTPQNAYQLRDHITQNRGATTANHIIGLLSHIFTKAIEWGVVNEHPIVGKVKKNKIVVKQYVPELDEVYAALSVANPLLQCYVELKLMTGLRMTDMLSLQLSNIKEDGIHITPSKTQNTSGKAIIILWDEHGLLKSIIDRIRALPSNIGSMYLFCTRRGQPYIKPDKSCNAFQSMWQRWQNKALAEGVIQKKFAEKPLRNAVASEMDTTEEAAKLLAHSTTRVTEQRYRLKATKVKPFIKRKL